MVVAGESAGEVLAHISVGDGLGTVHEYLRAIVELRRAVDGEQQGKSLFQRERVAALTEEAVGVVVLDESQHVFRVGIEIVVAERVVDAVEPLPPGVGLLVLGLVDLVEEGEVHHRLEVGIAVGEFGVLLPGGGIGRFGHPRLADGIEIGVFLAEHLHPPCHRLTVGVGVGIHAYAVDAGILDPPLGVLYEIGHEVGVALVEIGHGGHKPSVDRLVQVDLRGIGIEHGRELITGLEIERVFSGLAFGQARAGVAARRLVFLCQPLGGVEPVVRGKVAEPGMLESAVVEDHVHHDLESFGVGIGDELAILLVGAEARVDAVVVGRGVAVIGGVAAVVGRVVLEYGGEPQGGHAQVGEVVEMLAYAFEVAAVTQTGLGAVDGVGIEPLDGAAVGMSAGEAVGHEHIQHIGIGEAVAVFAALVALPEFVAHVSLSGLRTEAERHRTGLGLPHVEVDKEVVGTIESHQRVDTRSGIVGRDLGRADVLAVDHELQGGVFHACIPVGRFDTVYFLGCSGSQCRCE